MNKLVNSLEFVALDTETTGLQKGSRVVEIAGVRFRGDENLKDYPSTLINPEMAIPAEVTAIHHITDEMVAGEPAAREVLAPFFEFCKGAYLIAHNAPFDRRILVGEVERLGFDMPDYYFLDTMKLAKIWVPHLKRFSLEKVAQYFGLKTETLHRAYEDTVLVREIFRKVCAVVAEKKGRQISLKDLLQNSSLLPFGDH